MNLGDSKLYRHSNILLGDLRSRTRAAIGTIQMNDVGTRIVAAHSDHIHVGGGGDFNRYQGIWVGGLYPIDMFAVVFYRIHRVEWEGGE